jgi:hypothetical protein
MPMTNRVAVTLALALALAVPLAAVEDLRAPGATLEKLAGDFSFTEGPTADAAGNVFGGADHRTLFITASKGLYSIRLRVKGANAAK